MKAKLKNTVAEIEKEKLDIEVLDSDPLTNLLPRTPVDSEGRPLLSPLAELVAMDLAMGLSIRTICDKRHTSNFTIKKLKESSDFMMVYMQFRHYMKAVEADKAHPYKMYLTKILQYADLKNATVGEAIQALKEMAKLDGAYPDEKSTKDINVNVKYEQLSDEDLQKSVAERMLTADNKIVKEVGKLAKQKSNDKSAKGPRRASKKKTS